MIKLTKTKDREGLGADQHTAGILHNIISTFLIRNLGGQRHLFINSMHWPHWSTLLWTAANKAMGPALGACASSSSYNAATSQYLGWVPGSSSSLQFPPTQTLGYKDADSSNWDAATFREPRSCSPLRLSRWDVSLSLPSYPLPLKQKKQNNTNF